MVRSEADVFTAVKDDVAMNEPGYMDYPEFINEDSVQEETEDII